MKLDYMLENLGKIVAHEEFLDAQQRGSGKYNYDSAIKLIAEVYNMTIKEINHRLQPYLQLERKIINSPKINVGEIIRKNNFELFGRGENSTPFIIVERVKKNSLKYQFTVNNIFTVNAWDVKVIDKEEATKLAKIWEGCTISETVNTEFSCIREDNGQPKAAMDPEGFKKVLYKYRVTREEPFEAYKCTICEKIHIGKTRKDESTTLV